ncbi:ankyrin repeat protein [Lederbergia galactosidilyticus]|uniref:ankyrin repeat domain-containing protein n=1 Tax=Lederbergia galactosidilytica TaxID=217031 RepID=UPI001AE3DBD3|nr:ankyrin repeat domain-containing protein [Lederbergia galactosidilytica]MBP1917527.1 ankyrin repeat protein [Lederbergia galactosidilytica]
MDKLKQNAGDVQMDFNKILESNQLFDIDLNINKHNVNNEVLGANLLFWHVYLDNLLIVKKLLEKGADPNQTDIHGRIPLEVGAYYGLFEICKVLLENGAKIDEYCIR